MMRPPPSDLQPPPSPKRQAVATVLSMTAEEVCERLAGSGRTLVQAAASFEAAAKAARALHAAEQLAEAQRRAALSAADLTAESMDAMVAEAERWMPRKVDETTLRKLLAGVRLFSAETETVEDDFGRSTTTERLLLKFHVPQRAVDSQQNETVERSTHKWEVWWTDAYGRGQVTSATDACMQTRSTPATHARLLLY